MCQVVSVTSYEIAPVDALTKHRDDYPMDYVSFTDPDYLAMADAINSNVEDPVSLFVLLC